MKGFILYFFHNYYFLSIWSVIMYVLKIQIVSCALHTLPIPSNFERKHDNCQKVMAAVWRVYNFLFIEKKIFVAFLLIFSRTVVRSHRSREGEGDLACIEKNREEEALFAQKLQFSYHFDKVPLPFIPFLRLSRKVFSDSNNHGQPRTQRRLLSRGNSYIEGIWTLVSSRGCHAIFIGPKIT